MAACRPSFLVRPFASVPSRPKMACWETVSSCSRPPPHRGHREGSGTSVLPLLRRLASGAGRRQRRPYFWLLFRPGFWGGALGWGREKGNCLSWTGLQSFFQHRSQPFTLGFQILILTPELLHLFGNIFPCHTPDSPASSLGKANFVQPVSRRQTITTNAGAATHGIDNDGSACRDSYQSASSTRL